MAKVIGPIHSDFAAGSLGSTVYKRNQYGLYAVEKPIYVDSPTVNQQTWRDNIAYLWTTWKNDAYFSAATRLKWYEFSRQFKSSTRYGRDIYSSAAQWFIKLNCHKHAAGRVLFTSPPVDPGCNYFPTFSISQNSTGIWLTTDPIPDSYQCVYIAWVPYQSTLRNFCPHSQVPIGYVIDTSDDPLLLINNADLDPSTLRYFFLLRSVDRYGRLSPMQYFYYDFAQLWTPSNPYLISSDSYIHQGAPTTNYGSSTIIQLWYDSGAVNNNRAVLFADLSMIPASVIIASATLNVYCTYNLSSCNVSLYRLLHNFAELQVTWNDRLTGTAWDTAGLGADLDYRVPAIDTISVNAVNAWFAFDITYLVQNYIQGVYSNFGFALFADTLDVVLNFASSNHGTPSLRPYIEITV